MATWWATLHGDSWHLKALVGLDVGVTEESSTFMMRVDGPHTDAAEVRRHALELAEVLNGLARMATPAHEPITVGGVTSRTFNNNDGTGTISLFVGDEVRVTDHAEVQLVDSATGLPVPAPPAPAVFAKGATIAQRDPNVQLALRFYGLQPTPETLWKVYEVIRDDVGGNASHIVSKGWATADQIDGFRSVHYPSAFGETARHGIEPTRPAPRNPMSLPQAQEFLRSLLEKWLASK